MLGCIRDGKIEKTWSKLKTDGCLLRYKMIKKKMLIEYIGKGNE